MDAACPLVGHSFRWVILKTILCLGGLPGKLQLMVQRSGEKCSWDEKKTLQNDGVNYTNLCW